MGAIFFYVYTGQITFTTIDWKDVPSKAKETQDGSTPDRRYAPQGGASVPPPGAVTGDPCSPKSICRLAEQVCAVLPLLGSLVTDKSFTQVGFTELCDTAFEDI